MQRSDWGNREEIEAEASRLLVRLSSDPGHDEEKRICEWIDAHPDHAVAFARAEAAWEQAGRLNASQPLTLSEDQDVAAEIGPDDIDQNVSQHSRFLIGGIL